MDEVFGEENFVSQISYKTKKMTLGISCLGTVNDYIFCWAGAIPAWRSPWCCSWAALWP